MEIILERHRTLMVEFLWVAMLLMLAASLWIFSRFTVDDAFITWRYGRNLVDAGVWNYNPSTLDITQAYTNPIFAIISILPAIMGVDVVLFFKFAAVLAFAAVYLFFQKRLVGWCLALFVLFLGLPATVIHAFGGLETFLFVCLLAVSMIGLLENKVTLVVAGTLCLFLTRPESWLLVIVVPVYFLIADSKVPRNAEPSGVLRGNGFRWRQATLVFLVLALPLVAYFGFHYLLFGKMLPNTFYVKSGAPFGIRRFIIYCALIMPYLLILKNARQGFYC